jgi:acetylornithine deacetylase/succinyl-diaminopimelate desuccinylase-like protein
MNILDYIEENKDRFLEELFELLRIPSISANPKYADDVKRTAEFIANSLKEVGIEKIQIYPTKGHPIVYAEHFVSADLPTVLVYGHYDVQPPDPLELWDSPPFEPILKDEKIYARGACDDKGQLYMHVKAFEYMHKENQVPCNIKFIIEGEEEVGSDNLEIFCKEHKKMIECDVVLISDTSIIANDVPSMTSGLRGICYMEVEVVGPNKDLHSGVYGGGVANPINILSNIISDLIDDDGKITIEGFYDDVIELSESERKKLSLAPFDLVEYKNELGINSVQGEAGYSTMERTSIRPALDVNGIWGGYTGKGAKTVLPSKASAKISMRLVPNQDSHIIAKLFEKHFKNVAPDSVTVKVTEHHGGEPSVIPSDSTEFQAANKAMTKTFNIDPVIQTGGGSIPVVALFKEVLEVNSILMGFGLDSDDIHSPNEHFGLFNFYKGIETIPYFYQYYSEMKS